MQIHAKKGYENNRHPKSNPSELAADILKIVMRYRRVAEQNKECAREKCSSCIAPHMSQIISTIERNEAIVFVLPAFPGKSPNPAKVLGTRPDMAERKSLIFLDSICREIDKIYSPGAEIFICSDGRVFNDVVGIQEKDITTYQQDILAIIKELSLTKLKIFNLDDVFDHGNFDAMRSSLLENYAEPLEALEISVRINKEVNCLYRGITRFLFEDGMHPNMSISKTSLQKQCRKRALKVIQRSRAWDQLLAKHFPRAVRLSIHPQMCGSRKIGVHLMETTDEWLTPWHSVAIAIGGRFRLMKRSHINMLEAKLVFHDGRPSHYIANTSLELGLWK